jgi:hypothetical protein
MNGKSCRFSSQFSGKSQNESRKAFVIMPFDSNFRAIYDWKLKKYLADKFNIREKNIRIAEEITNIGYIICEKVCNKIQSSDLIFADISLENPNVFYELGLASGLQLPIILIQNKDIKTKCEIKCEYISAVKSYFNENNILNYSVSEINDSRDKNNNDYNLINSNPPPTIMRQKRCLKSFVLSFGNKNLSSRSKCDDLIDFGTLIKVAAEKAINDIISIKENLDKLYDKDDVAVDMQSSEELTAFSEPLKYAMKNYRSTDFLNVDPEAVIDNFEKIAQKIAESFCVIIDISDNNPLAYFWLGYTHARGFNAIPVNRIRSIDGKQDKSLSFDLNALWYAEYDENNPTRLRDDLRRTIISLLERDLPDWQRQAFWDRFPQESKLKVFMGAIHHNDPEREVVGDWDVRAVSELFSYLPSIRNAATIQLVKPIYSPEVAEVQLKDQISTNDFNEKFQKGIKDELANSNAIVIASPDVNPVTEYLLWKIYGIQEYNNTDDLKPFIELNSSKSVKRKGFVAVKRGKKTNNTKDKNGEKRLFYIHEPYRECRFEWDKVPGDDSQAFIALLTDNFGIDWVEKDTISKSDLNTINASSDGTSNDADFLSLIIENNKAIMDITKSTKKSGSGDEQKGRRIELMVKNKPGAKIVFNDPDKEYRGFKQYYYDSMSKKTRSRLFLEEYKSQLDIKKSDKGFDLLGHLVVAYYPTNEKKNLVVLLNGISGPATFVLSQLIIGFGETPSPEKRLISENMLEQLNTLLDKVSGKDGDDAINKGVEAIIKVSINKEMELNFTFVDTRKVEESSLDYIVGPSIISDPKDPRVYAIPGGNIT